MADILVPATCPHCGAGIMVKVREAAIAEATRGKPARPIGSRVQAQSGKRAKRDAPLAIRPAASVSIRDDAGSDGRTIEGILFPYNAPTLPGGAAEFPGMREQFAPGAFAGWLASRDDAAPPVPIVDRHNGDVIGAAREFFDSAEGLRFRGRLFGSTRAAEFAEAVREGVNGVSGEFMIHKYRKMAGVVTHTLVPMVGAIAGSYKPAYAGARVAVRESGGSNMNCEHCGEALLPGVAHECQREPVATPTTGTGFAGRQAAVPGVPGAVAGEVPMSREAITRLVRETADESMRLLAERNLGGRAAIADPWQDLRGYRSLGEVVQAAAQDDADPQLVRWAARALADQLTTDNNAGVTTPGILGNLRRLVDRGRPAITAFGGPASLEGTGLSFSFPYYDGTLANLVGEQATQKTEITSAKVEIKAGSVTIKTYAGGSDIAYQLIRRSSPSYLEMYTRIILAAWALVTDAAFVTALEAGTVTVDFAEAITAVDATELKGWLIDAAVAVDLATGTPAEFALAGTTAFKAAAKLLNPAPVFNAVGTMNLRQLEVNVGGLPIIHDPNVTTDKFIVSNREAARWHEDGPFQATAEDVAKLGRDVAYWSLGAAAIYVPAAVVEVYDVTP